MQMEAFISTNHLAENFEDFFEQALCGFIISNSTGFIERINTKAATWAGYSPDELKGKRFSDLLSIGGQVYYETHLSPLLRIQGYFEEVVLEMKTRPGQKMRVLVNAQERRDANGNPLFIRYTVLKASDRLIYEQNLQQAKLTAEDALLKQTEITALREQLIAVLGHDLRNPLAAVAMAVELLEIAKPGENNAELVAILKRSCLRMKELVGNIMDFAKTRLGGGILISRQQIYLQPVLQQVIDELQLGNVQREIIGSFNLTGLVNCDPNRIAQLMSNLLANALMHGAAGSPVFINAHYRNNTLEISVSNSGEPIPPRLLENIFDPFTRETNRPRQQGLGLGLFISKEIALAHGGSLSCVSTAEATTFTFRM